MLVSFALSVFSQDDFRKGFIVKLNGDTLKGYVNFRKEAENHRACNFKRFQIAFPVNYTPEKIKAYGIDNEKQYISANLNDKKVFIEFLVKGKISLLYFKSGSTHFYINDTEGNLVELSSGKMNDANRAFQNYKEYLSSIMSNVNISELINESKFEITSLILIIKRYNELSNVLFEIPQRPRGKSLVKDYNVFGSNKVTFGVETGTNILSLKCVADAVGNVGYDYITKANFKPRTNPILGLYLGGKLSKSLPKLYVQTEILFHRVSLYGSSSYTEYMYASNHIYNDLFINFTNLCIQGTIKYSFNLNDFKILPHAGIGYIFYLNASYNRYYQIYNAGSNTVSSYEYSDLAISNNNFPVLGGITIDYQLTSARIISFNIDYILGNNPVKKIKNNYTNEIYLKSKGTAINLTLGISL
jgi:hypothetical protein